MNLTRMHFGRRSLEASKSGNRPWTPQLPEYRKYQRVAATVGSSCIS
jgi:hypothetical protein